MRNQLLGIKPIAVLLCAMALTWSAVSDAARSRVKIQNNNVVASNGKPLRGAAFFLDIFSISDMRNNETQWENYFKKVTTDYNMNLVRISPWIGNWEYMQKSDSNYETHKKDILYMVDKVVDWADEAGIYAVVNMHIAYGTKVNLTNSKDFWNVMAPRYKDRTHVFYELVNEPEIPTAKNNMAKLYSHVRDKAPNTHLILWSVNNPSNLTKSEIDNNSGGIDYSNASVGYHIYEYTLGKRKQHDLADGYRKSYPTINTEFYSLDNANYYPIDYDFLVDNIKVMENRNYSWMQWSPVFNFRNENKNLDNSDLGFSQTYKNKIENAGITYWAKDTGGSSGSNNGGGSSDGNSGDSATDGKNTGTTSIAGNRRLRDSWKGRYLHVRDKSNWNTVSSKALNTDWSSQKFKMEKVSNGIFRVKNTWSNKYLTSGSTNDWDDVYMANLNSDWSSQKWKFVKVNNQYRLQNQWSKLYLTAPEKAGQAYRQAPLNTGWSSQKFNLKAY